MPCNHLILCCPLSSCIQSFPVSGSFPVSWLFSSGSQSIGVSALVSVLPMNIQGWFPLGLTGLISLQSKRLSRVFSNITVQKNQFFRAQFSLWPNCHIHTWLLEKTIALTIWTFVSKLMSLLFNILSRFVIAFLPRSKCPLISWLQSSSAVILEKLGISLWWSLVDIYQRFPLRWTDWKSLKSKGLSRVFSNTTVQKH